MMAVLRIFEHLADGALKLMWGGVIRCKVNARARPMDARVRICLVLGKTRSDDWYPETQRLVDAAVAAVRHKGIDLWQKPFERQISSNSGIVRYRPGNSFGSASPGRHHDKEILLIRKCL